MHPIHDVDVVILLATMMSSKRRPAELVELVAAADMIQGFIPYESKLGDAVSRLSCHGLICQEGQGFALTPDATKILAAMPRKGDAEQHLAFIREKLVGYYPKLEYPIIDLTADQLAAAVGAHKQALGKPVKNLLMPKPKLDSHFKVDGRWRRVPGGRERKS